MTNAMKDEWRATFHEAMARHVETGQMPGLIALVGAATRCTSKSSERRSSVTRTASATDTIFRIASLTKPIIAVATMMLVDEGTLRLDQAVEELLPELADRRVLQRPRRRARRHRAGETLDHGRGSAHFRLGFGCILAMPGTYPIQIAEEELQLHTIGEPWPPPPPLTNDEWIAALGTLPLDASAR